MHTGFWWRDLRAGDHLEDPCVDGRIILKWIFEKWDGGIDWIDLAQDWDRWAGCCECGNETLDFIKFGAFADWQRTSWLLRMDCAAWSMSKYLLVQSRTSSKVARNLVERHCSTWQCGSFSDLQCKHGVLSRSQWFISAVQYPLKEDGGRLNGYVEERSMQRWNWCSVRIYGRKLRQPLTVCR
jgi:hypothetical protein